MAAADLIEAGARGIVSGLLVGAAGLLFGASLLAACATAAVVCLLVRASWLGGC